MRTKPCLLSDPVVVEKLIDEYFAEREQQQEVRELKNGDKRVYRTPPSLYGLATKLGVDKRTLLRYLDKDVETDENYVGEGSYQTEICRLLIDARERIIEELTEGVALGYWNERLVLAQLAHFGVLGTQDTTEVKVLIQGSDKWSE